MSWGWSMKKKNSWSILCLSICIVIFLAFWHCLIWSSSQYHRVTSKSKSWFKSWNNFYTTCCFIHPTVSECVFPKYRGMISMSACVHPRCVIMSGSLERSWSRWWGRRGGRGREQKVRGERRRWDKGGEERSCCVCSCCPHNGSHEMFPRWTVNQTALSITVCPPSFFFQLFCSFLLLSSLNTKSSTVSPSACCMWARGCSAVSLDCQTAAL